MTDTPGINAFAAHAQWASRPPDERYSSVASLLDAARRRRERTTEVMVDEREWMKHVRANDSDLELSWGEESPRRLTHWSMDQLAREAGAPAAYLRALPAAIAADALNFGLHSARRPQQALVDKATDGVVHALTSPRYSRVHHDDLVHRVTTMMSARPAWKLPLGYRNGQLGEELVPSGAYLGDRDMFLLLVDESRALEDPTDRSRSGLFRGFVLRNSDVGAAALTIDLFLYRAICHNHIIWGFDSLAAFRRRHVGASIYEDWTAAAHALEEAIDTDATKDNALLRRAACLELGETREDVITTARRRLDLTQGQAAGAYDLAEADGENPRSHWGYAQGLTRLSQDQPWQSARFALDRAAGQLLKDIA